MVILTVNSGSSSLKLAMFSQDGTQKLVEASADRLGASGGVLKIVGNNNAVLFEQPQAYTDASSAFDPALAAMAKVVPESVTAIGHRVVHGGPHLRQHQRITPELLQTLEQAVHFAPLHIPPALDLIRHTEARFSSLKQCACFDTAFHQTMPPEAYTYPIPQQYRDAGVRRYGFHGLSYESIVRAVQGLSNGSMPERMVVMHLGAGASACAIRDGRSIDTTMGLSPMGGFPMATRTGDLDPGVVLMLARGLGDGLTPLTPDALEILLDTKSGLLALAGDGDMRALEKASDNGNAAADLTLRIFYREIARRVAGFIALMGGVELLVFTGGIGEHSARLRSAVSQHLAIFGVSLNPSANQKQPCALISSTESRIAVQVLTADENGQLARHVAAMP